MQDDDITLQMASPNRLLTTILIFASVGLTVVAYLLHTDPGQFALTSPETLVFLDGAMRVMQGDLPNHDFSAPFGPALWVIPSLFLSKSDVWLTIPSLLITFTALGTLLVALLLKPQNITQFLAALALMAFCAVALNAPAPWLQTTLASTTILVISAWITTRLMGQDDPLSWPAAVVLGLSLFGLFMIQIPYFLLALLLLLACLRDAGRALAIFVTPLLFSTVLFPAVVISYAAEITNMFRGDVTQIAANLEPLIEQIALPLAALVALIFLALRADPSRARPLLVFVVWGGLITVGLYAVEGTTITPTVIFGIIAGLGFSLLAHSGFQQALLPLIILLTAFAQEAYIKTNTLKENHILADASDTVTYNRIRIDTVDGLVPYIRTAEKALEHIDQTGDQSCRAKGILVADFTNPFNTLLARSDKGAEALWIMQQGQELQGHALEASFVLVPNTPLQPDATAYVLETYAEALETHSVVFENEGWAVYGETGCR